MARVVNKRKLTAADLQAIGRVLVEILGGVRPGEVAIVAGQQGLQDGAVVRIVEPRETLQREP